MKKLLLILSLALLSTFAFAAEGILAGPSIPKEEPIVSDVVTPADPGSMVTYSAAVQPPAQPVPEPGSMVALGTAGALLLARRSRRKS